jgi:hypothetical protein
VDGICIGTPTPRLVLVVAATRRSATAYSEEYNVAMSQQLLYSLDTRWADTDEFDGDGLRAILVWIAG